MSACSVYGLRGSRKLEQDSLTTLSLADYWSMLLRRKWLALAIFLACVAGAGALCVALPVSYRSSTLILVEGQKIPENYVQSVIGPTIEERLNSIQQQVMSRTVLTQMIKEFSLYPDAVGRSGIEDVVERLQKDVSVTTMASKVQRAAGGIDSFSISFAHENPVLAMKVTERLASNFIEENLKVREQLVEGASEFLEQELALAKERLEEQEKAIGTFKTRHMGELPEQIQANISTLDRLGLQQSTTMEAIQKASDRLTLMDKMIKEYESPGAAPVGMVSGLGGAQVVDPFVVRLKELERNLASLAAEYKENYPDVVSLKEEIKNLKAQIANKPKEKMEPANHSEPVRESRVSDVYLRELMRQRDEAKLELSSLKERLFRIKQQIRDYEGRVEKAPAREQELMILDRDYHNLRENYKTLLDKKLNARLAENLEKRQKGEQFRVLDPANLPTKPEKPNRLNIMLVGLALGCGAGIGWVFVLESLKPVFRRSEDVESYLQLKVLASIPNFRSILGRDHRLLPGSIEVTSAVKPLKALLGAGSDSNGEAGGDYGCGHSKKVVLAQPYFAKRLSNKDGIRKELELIGKWNPASITAEQFRVAATRLLLLHSKKSGNITVVTSSVKGEGKSAVSANLAYALAKDLGKRTLLVDGDLKCPMVHQYMGIPAYPGLRQVLEKGPIESCLHREEQLPLWVLPSGLASGQYLDLSNIRYLADLLKDLKDSYDHVIVDAPPVLPLADMHVLAGMADAVTFVIRAGMTPRTLVEHAVHALGVTDRTCIILNGLEASGVPYYLQESAGYLQPRSR